MQEKEEVTFTYYFENLPPRAACIQGCQIRPPDFHDWWSVRSRAHEGLL